MSARRRFRLSTEAGAYGIAGETASFAIFFSDGDASIFRDGDVTGLPWKGVDSRRMARVLWGRLEPFVNLPEHDAEAKLQPLGIAGPYGTYAKLRLCLLELVEGRWSPNGKAITFPAAPLCIIARAGRLSWGMRHVDPMRVETAADLEREARFLLGLLALPAVRPLLRSCGTCGRFMLKRNVRRPKRKKTDSRRAFCSDACRRRADARDGTRRQSDYRGRAFRS